MGSGQRSFSFEGTAWGRILAVITVVFAMASLPVAGDDRLGGPAMAEAANPDALVAPARDPSALTVGTQSPGALTVPTTGLPAPVESQSPANLQVSTESPSDLVGHTQNLEDLPDAATSEAAARQAVASQVAESQPGVFTPDSLSAARSQLAAAQAELDRVDSAIGTMLERDYPTGEARLRLYDEQDAARRRVAASKETLQRFESSGGEFSE